MTEEKSVDMIKERCATRNLLVAAGVLGFLLVVFGVVLIGLAVPDVSFVKIGTIIAGLLLLIVVGSFFLLRNKRILCILLALVTLFLIIAGIVALPSIIGFVLIGLGVISLILAAVCFAEH